MNSRSRIRKQFIKKLGGHIDKPVSVKHSRDVTTIRSFLSYDKQWFEDHRDYALREMVEFLVSDLLDTNLVSVSEANDFEHDKVIVAMKVDILVPENKETPAYPRYE